MMKTGNVFTLLLCSACLIFIGLMVTSGCTKAKTPEPEPRNAVTAEEAVVPQVDPFRDAAGNPGDSRVAASAAKVATIAASAAAEVPSLASLAKINELHISGFGIVLLAFAARLLFGRWKDGYIAAGLGCVPAAFAVLLSEHSTRLFFLSRDSSS